MIEVGARRVGQYACKKLHNNRGTQDAPGGLHVDALSPLGGPLLPPPCQQTGSSALIRQKLFHI